MRTTLLLLAVNFVLIPLFAIIVLRVFAPPAAHGLGLFVLAAGAGAPFVIKLVSAAQGHIAKTASMLVLLVVATVVYLPLVVPLVLTSPALSGIVHAPVRGAAVASPLVLDLLLPLAAGLVVRARNARSRSAARIMGRVASVAMIVLVAATVLANLRGSSACSPPRRCRRSSRSSWVRSRSATSRGAAIARTGSCWASAQRSATSRRGWSSPRRASATREPSASWSRRDDRHRAVYGIARFLRRHQRAQPRGWSRKRWGDRWGTPVTG